MTDSPTRPRSVRFGTFEVDLESHEIRKRGFRLRLEEKPFQILALLLEKPGQVVSRRTLRDHLWPDMFVGYEQGLNTAINKLRMALSDSPQNPRFVETLPRVGYRFIAPVERSLRPAQANGKKMLLVLPFENLSGDPAQEYFAEGLTEELISQLGQLNPKRLGVIARTSAAFYRGAKKTVGEIARELNVDYILEGSVRKEKRNVRIITNLIDPADQTHLWSGNYERELRDILRVQNDVAINVGRTLALELLPTHRQTSENANPAAHEAYLRGRFLFGQRTEECLKQAIEAFELALQHQPDHPQALSGIADCVNTLCWFGALHPHQAGPRALQAAQRALAIDNRNADAHASLALVHYWYEWNWAAAEQEFRTALDLNPNLAAAHQWYASFLNAMGRFEESAEVQQRARELDPLSLIIQMNTADPLFFSRRYDQAIQHLSALRDRVPFFYPVLFNLGRAFLQKKQFPQAIEAIEKAWQLSRNKESLPALARAYALAGRTEEAKNLLSEILAPSTERHIAAPMIAWIYLGLRQLDDCFAWLRRGVEEHSYWCVFFDVDPAYDPIRKDPRFQELLRQVGFDPTPQLASKSATS